MLHIVPQTGSRSSANRVAFPLALLGSLLVVEVGAAQAADPAPSATLRAWVGGGVGAQQYALPGAKGARRLQPAPVPAVAAEVALMHALSARVRVGGQIGYASSLGYTLATELEPDTREVATGRNQDLGLLGRAGLALGNWPAPPVVTLLLGYGLAAFNTDAPLVTAASYMLSGPRAGIELSWPWPAARLVVAAGAELGANLTASSELRAAGVEPFGPSYAWQLQAEVALTPAWSIGARLREAHVSLPLSSTGRFDDVHRFGVVFVSVQTGS